MFDQERRCIIKNDNLNAYIQKMIEADGIILVSPVYFSMMSHKLNALTLYVARANNDLFKRKIGAAVVAVRRAGEIPTFDVMSHYS